MIKLTNFFVVLFLCLFVTNVNAQDSLKVTGKQAELARFETYKAKVEENEKEALKAEVESRCWNYY